MTWAPPAKCEGYFIDPKTGEIHFRATKTEVTVLAYRADIYGFDTSGRPFKRGTLIRDIELVMVDNKSNTIPTLSGLNGSSGSTDTSICAGAKQCFVLNTYDANSSDSIFVDSTLNWPWGGTAPTISVEKAKAHPRVTVCWTPDASQVRPEPYPITIFAKDNVCPLSGMTSKQYHIRVTGGSDSIVAKIVNIQCGLATFRAYPKHAGGKLGTVTWSGDSGLTGTGDSINFRYKTPGTYKWRASAGSGACMVQDSGLVIVSKPFSIKPSYNPRVCYSDTGAQIINLSPTSNSGTVYYRWSSGYTTSYFGFTFKKDTTLYYTAIDSVSSGKSCRYSDSLHVVRLDSLYRGISISQTGCREISYSVNGASYPTTGFTWSGDDTLTSNASFAVHNYSAPGVFHYQLMAQDGSCTQSDTGSVIIRDLSMKLNGDTFACAADSSVITLSSVVKNASLSGVSYIWSDSSKLSNLTFKARKDTAFKLLIQDNATTCQKRDSIHIHVEPAGAKPCDNILRRMALDSHQSLQIPVVFHRRDHQRS